MYRFVFLILGMLPGVWAQWKVAGPLYSLSTVAGVGAQDRVNAFSPETLALDGAGNLYIGDRRGAVEKVTSSGSMTVIAGPGVPGFSADGANGTIQLGSPIGVAADVSGNVYIADTSHDRVLKLAPDGSVAAFAGTGVRGNSGDGGPAPATPLNQPFALAIDGFGNVYIGEYGGARVRRVAPDGTISTVAGNGQFGIAGDSGPATSAQIAVVGLALDRVGALYIADGVSRVREVGTDGIIRTVAGGGKGAADPRTNLGVDQDEVPATSTALVNPWAVAVDAAGNLYIAAWHRVRKVTVDGVIHTAAGDGIQGRLLGPGREATLSQLSFPSGLALDAAGNIYIADPLNSTVNRVDRQGKIRLYARAPLGDGGPAPSAFLPNPTSVAPDARGNIFVNDGAGRIRKINSAGVISTVAGSGEQGLDADEIVATRAPLNSPAQIAASPAGDVFIADASNHRVVRVSPDGIMHAVAGSGGSGFGGDGGPAVLAQLSSPSGVAVDAAGNVYIADAGNYRIRKVSAGGIITTFAGDGTPAQLSGQMSLAVDVAGNVYVADTGNSRVLRISPSAVVTTVAGTGKAGLDADGVPAASAALRPFAVTVDPEGSVLIADGRIRRVRQDGIIDTVAGGVEPSSISSGPAAVEGVPAFLTPLGFSSSIASDLAGNLFIADYDAGRVYKAAPQGSRGTGPPKLFPHAVVNSANLLPGPVAPGELVTVFGSDLGPVAGIGAKIDASGRIGTNLAGVRVLFDGVPAPVLYAQGYQVNTIVPFALQAGATVHVQVEYNGTVSNEATVEVAEAAPAIFALGVPAPRPARAAAVNQDGTINTPDNPAPGGSILTLYITGAGAMQPDLADGALAGSADGKPVLLVFVSTQVGIPEILYAGAAPGLVAGVLQINIRVPHWSICRVCANIPPNPDAIPVIVGLGPPSLGYYPATYFSRVYVTIAVKPDQ